MKSFCIGVLAGCLLSLFLPIVPPFFTLFLLTASIFILLAYRQWCLAGVAAFFICWIWHYTAYAQAQQQLLSTASALTGVIVGTPKHYAEYSQFHFKLDSAPGRNYQLILNWSAPATVLRPGQRWRLNARLKPVAGVANPGGVNREAQALLQQVLAQGSVDTATEPKLLAQQFNLRQYWLDKMQDATAALNTGPLLLALTMGERQFSRELWLGLQQSGLAHLVAISGLHIGLVFGWVLWLLRILPWPLRYLPWRRPLALLVAMLASCSYAWLAGFAIPTVRAMLALLLLVVALLQHRNLSYSHYWLLLCAVLLLAEPFLALSKSFWLSMLAVGVIFSLLWQQGPARLSRWQRLLLFLRFHISLSLFMALLSVLMFGGSSALTLLSNLLFVPWCTLLAIPLLLLGLLAELTGLPGRSLLWQLCDAVFQPLQWWLKWSASQQSWWAVPDVPLLSIVALALVSLALYLSGRRWLYSALALSLLPLLLAFHRPAQWQLHLIDVGQGLAVLLQHGQRGLLYDAGPRYGSHSATAAQVLPYLRSRGVRQLDYLILSHDDSDHTGDWPLLLRHYPQAQIYSDISHIDAARPCAQLPKQFGAARLTLLDSQGDFSSKNDRSCVLLIELYQWRILLPGDIGRQVEQQLLARYPQLQAHVLVLSHHGSNSSSHYAFLHQLSPMLALNSASLYNRHQHPAPAVQQRLQQLGIELLNTAQSGAIRLNITEPDIVIKQYRAQRIPYWLQKPVGNAETLDATR